MFESPSHDLAAPAGNGVTLRNGPHLTGPPRFRLRPAVGPPSANLTPDELFDQVRLKLGSDGGSSDSVRKIMDHLFHHLHHWRRTLPADGWQNFIQQSRQHPLHRTFLEDAFTRRAYEKPRGYAGDAVMMDYIYGREERWPLPEMSPLGRRVFGYTTGSPASSGVRARRAYIADLLDRLEYRVRQPHILSVACGHLREANLSALMRRGRFGRFVALDADAESLDEVNRCYGPWNVETHCQNIRELLRGNRLGEFDLVYSLGLFDYLNASTARRLATSLFAQLRPGGTLVIANFMDDILDAAYMEAFMDWNLVYRTRLDMIHMTSDIPQYEIGEVRILTEEYDNVILLLVSRREGEDPGKGRH